MKENKKEIIKALTTKYIETIKTTKLSSISGGDGCIIIVDPR